jgi:hypothetical protein
MYYAKCHIIKFSIFSLHQQIVMLTFTGHDISRPHLVSLGLLEIIYVTISTINSVAQFQGCTLMSMRFCVFSDSVLQQELQAW